MVYKSSHTLSDLVPKPKPPQMVSSYIKNFFYKTVSLPFNQVFIIKLSLSPGNFKLNSLFQLTFSTEKCLVKISHQYRETLSLSLSILFFFKIMNPTSAKYQQNHIYSNYSKLLTLIPKTRLRFMQVNHVCSLQRLYNGEVYRFFHNNSNLTYNNLRKIIDYPIPI